MHFLTGLFISSVFQTAHVVPATDFPLPDKNGQMDNWSIHQLLTTSNFSPKSRLTSWMIGGLNYQIEHHLFPNICHIHYKKIAPIVRQTAKEFGTPYLIKQTFAEALWDHLKMLYWLGRMDTVPVKQ
jgi:linoleoyl-CoA desaturase